MSRGHHLKGLSGVLLLALMGSDRPAGTRADPLWAPQGAAYQVDATTMRAGACVYEDGSASLTFTVVTRELERLTTDLTDHFAREGWRQRGTQWLNPGQPTSFSAGWEHICACIIQISPDGERIEPPHMYQWTGEWQDQRGDVIRYLLSAIDDRVHGIGSYVPARTTRKALRRLGR